MYCTERKDTGSLYEAMRMGILRRSGERSEVEGRVPRREGRQSTPGDARSVEAAGVVANVID